jgi:hypothetical protein
MVGLTLTRQELELDWSWELGAACVVFLALLGSDALASFARLPAPGVATTAR